jgi:predicted ATPase
MLQVTEMPEHNTITRVVLKNYKSIRDCDVQLGPITFLVGPNGSGKSNFLEALRFLSYGLSTSLEQSLDSRSGFRSIVHRGADDPARFSIEVFFRLGIEKHGRYLMELGGLEDGRAGITREECSVKTGSVIDWFTVQAGRVESSEGVAPLASDDKLYLVKASGLAAFEPVYRRLTGIVIYNPVPDDIRGFKPEKLYRNLDRNGSGVAEAVYRLKAFAPDRLARVTDYLRRVNSNVLDIDAVSVDANYNLRFGLDRGGGVREEFPSQSVSDGTLRALAVLVALFQSSERNPLSLIGLEEPEAGLHPAAASVLFDSLMEGSGLNQIVVTSHSPDLLDRDDIPENSVKAVAMFDGRTIIGEADEAGKTALKNRLYTTGELMRMDQLRPVGAPDCADAR